MRDDSADAATEIFVGHRELLFSIVYNLLGSVADAEDVLQETWLSWASRNAAPPGGENGENGEIGNPRAYLVRIAVNHALTRQAGIARRRETYFGPWLPEPLVEGADPTGWAGAAGAAAAAERVESVSMAMMVVLETLTPLERAVFVLHEVFGYPHTEIAGILGRTAPAVRQVAHRAREHVRARRPRYRADPAVRRRATERFVFAVAGGDLEGLMEILAPDVTLWADGGGKAVAAGARPVHGRDRVARLIIAARARSPITDMDISFRAVNGDPSAVLSTGAGPFAVIVLELSGDGLVSRIYTVTNPDKLSRLITP